MVACRIALAVAILVALAVCEAKHQEELPKEIRKPLDGRRHPSHAIFRRAAQPGDKGKVSGGIYQEPGVGVVGKVSGHGTVWESDNKKGRVEAHGDWSKVLDGPRRGKPQTSGGVSFTYDFD